MNQPVDEQERKAQSITAQFEKRKEERAVLNAKKNEDVERASKLETYEYFIQNFKEGCDSLRKMLDDDQFSSNPDRALVSDYLEKLSVKYEKLRKFLNDSTVFLRSYQLERAQKTLIELEVDILSKKETLQPRKKFAFKSKKKVAEVAKDTPAPVVKNQAATHVNKLLSQCQVSSKNEETICIAKQELDGNDVSLSKLQNCVVMLQGHPGTVHISDIQNCTVLCGPVSGSVFVEKCKSSRIVNGCQQLRIHETNDTDFYLHVTSRAIIEDSEGLRFAPYNWTYASYEADLISSGLRNGINNWDEVDDFNWLSNEPSPNWSVLPEPERRTSWADFEKKC